MESSVRCANESDFNDIFTMLMEDLEEQGVLYRFQYSKEKFKDLIFGKNPRATFLILIIDAQSAGFANYSIDYRNFTVNTSANLYVNDLYIKKEYRRRKGATLLFEELKRIARTSDCARIEGVVLADNSEALEFYNFHNCKMISDKLHYMRLELE
ncbi:GNAT family N-acetyltransferase [Legionella clemsonensis]|uniref:Acetyltransferase (GNAT) family protein n=1 Tax=Legionella clemsonensis TaxID=1867846 RepID=A0A222NYQ7_9GAMM|nr:GNAT family N-acetyltransferase [Legionella clemsonensis]ASQ44716.1 Acetyltransferase (GNAT) family protein [Legionella clemsonensis]